MGLVFVECTLGILLWWLNCHSSFPGTSLSVHLGELYLLQGLVTVV